LLWEGGRIGFEPAAVVLHRHRGSPEELRRQVHGYGIGYTACLTSLVRRDRRHAAGIARQLPIALRRYAARPAAPAQAGTGHRRGSARVYPRHLRLLELSGYLRGPSSYLVSVRKARRWAG
jgi:hypothetical protein